MTSPSCLETEPRLAGPANPTDRSNRLPLAKLAALTFAAFIALLTEIMPAGLLPQISEGLRISDSLSGQFIATTGIGAMLAAIPLMLTTQGISRKRLTLIAAGGLVAMNCVTALSDQYVITLGARFLGGIFIGLNWSVVFVYALRLVPPHLAARTIAIMTLAIPLAFTLGAPTVAFLGKIIGWRETFCIVGLCGILDLMWMAIALPDAAGHARQAKVRLVPTFFLPGLRAVLFATLTYVLAYSILYTYIAPLLANAHLTEHVDSLLLIFGGASVLGVIVSAIWADRWLRGMILGSTLLFAACAIALGAWNESPSAVTLAIAFWGIAYGIGPALLTAATSQTGGEAADVAQAFLVTVWNLSVAGGGVIGGFVLSQFGIAPFPWIAAGLLALSLATIWLAKSHGFPKAAKAVPT
ncbi:MFS transporter [Methylovirgula sp. 4M-Z18]|uniref:MFS transporter n=1 Tax=Methylovirgula sp. 4M-Z18 TaxID=2293567 RepID=UPI000E2FBFEB|nr:MFS transporter [Methylovirgula sp. 4M-Z18]RFB78056.1 MFS transporter [Methylovirgula sp. 4M-Z18]